MSLVLTDKGFELPTEPCRNAVTTARELLTWMDDNVDSATHVANKVVSGLEKCFSSKARNPRTRRDKMFTKFYGLRSSKEYRVFWSKIMRDSIGQTAPCPTFYQFVVDSVMEEIVKTKFPIIPQPSEPETVIRQLDFKEQCGLRYTLGAVIRAVRKTVNTSAKSKERKRELLSCLKTLEDTGIPSPAP